MREQAGLKFIAYLDSVQIHSKFSLIILSLVTLSR